MKSLLNFTALIEAATGLALLIVPSVVVALLLGVSLTEPGGILLGRIGGAALVSLAMACWLSKNDPKTSIAVVKALTLYNILSALLLAYAALIEHFSAMGLWAALVLHVVLLGWCIRSLRSK